MCTGKDYEAPADRRYWYVMTHLEPSLIDRQLQSENAVRLGKGQPALLYVIPYLYMSKASMSRAQSDGSGTSRECLESQKAAADHNSLRDSLHGFVFIRATDAEISDLTGRDWNRYGRLHLFHYRTKSGSPIKVCSAEMQPLLDFLIERHHRFSFMPYAACPPSVESVYIKRGIFKDRKATVIEVHHRASGISLTLGLPMFGNEVMMELYDYSVSDVEVQGSLEHVFEPQFVRCFESDLLSILRRRVLHRHTEATYRDDMKKLNAYGLLHYLRFEDGSVHGHFQSLLLLCAALRRDSHARDALLPVVHGLMSSPTEPSTDDDAFYLCVLFLATMNVSYRKQVRAYIRTHEVRSSSLAAILPLVKKVQLRGSS